MLNDAIPTPSPIIHPVTFHPCAVYTPSRRIKSHTHCIGTPASTHSIDSDTTPQAFIGCIKGYLEALIEIVKLSLDLMSSCMTVNCTSVSW